MSRLIVKSLCGQGKKAIALDVFYGRRLVATTTLKYRNLPDKSAPV